MPSLDALFHKKLALINLGSGTAAVEPWPRALFNEAKRCIPGGAAAAALLSAIHGDALVLATGPLTGSATPGSSLLVASCPDAGGALAYVPIVLRHGLALKTANIDFAVVTGSAASPAALVLSSEGPSLEPADALATLDVPGMRRALRARFPESRHSLILRGPAALGEARCGSASLEAGSSLDRGALAAWMSRHNLSAIVLAGGGCLPDSISGNPLFNILGAKSGLGGFLDVLGHAGGGPQAKATAEKILGRAAACHGCPWPCMAYLRPGPSASGLLCADHAGFAALSEACPGSVHSALEACARIGIDPVAASAALRGLQPAAFEPALEKLISGTPAAPAAPTIPYAEAHERAAAGMVLGVCPILLGRTPDVPIEQWIAGLEDEKGADSFRDRLNASLALVSKAMESPRRKDTEL